MNEIWNVWDVVKPQNILGTNYTIKGFSIAALRTNFYIPELGIMLDAGLSYHLNPDYIFITHGHSDHTANIPYHVYNQINVKIYAPNVKNIGNYIDSAVKMSRFGDFLRKYDKRNYELHDAIIGEKYDFIIKNKNITVEIIKCFHSVPCVGYGFIEKRKKLKEEYKNLSGLEIKELKKTTIITYEHDFPFFCYLGDSDKNILTNKNILKYKNIMIECTFLYVDDLKQADKKFHLHWDYLKDFVIQNQDITFILYHFSQRYNKNKIIEFFKDFPLKNLIIWA